MFSQRLTIVFWLSLCQLGGGAYCQTPAATYSIARSNTEINVDGKLDEAAWKSSVDILTTYKIIKAAPSEGAYRTDLAQAALDMITKADAKADVMGTDWKAAEVAVTAGGE